MKYKCSDCGCIFNKDDSATVSEKVGEFWGAPAYMDYNACPECRSTDLENYSEDQDQEEE